MCKPIAPKARFLPGMVLLFLAACSSGGGGDNDTFKADDEPPTVNSVTPADGATGVGEDAVVRVIFSEEMAAATLTTTTFSLRDAGNNPVSGTVGYSGTVATFTPSAPLDYAMDYTATVTTGVTDLAGNHMATSYAWSFTTITATAVTATSPADQASQLLAATALEATFNRNLDPATVTASSFTLTDDAMNPVSGTAAAVGSTATFIPDADLAYGTTYSARLTTGVADSAGNNLPSDYVWSFSTIGLLGSAANVETATDNVSCSRAIFDSNGNGYVVWLQGPNTSSLSVWANRHASGGDWGTPTTIESSALSVSGCPALGADASGNVVAVWSQGGVITMNRYLSATGWGTPESVGGSAAISPAVAVDGSSNIFVVWAQGKSIWARRYENGVGWDTAAAIESYTTEAYTPDVVVDGSGDATAVWSQQQSGLLFYAAANRYTVGGGWGTPDMISSSASGLLNNEVVAEVSDSGHVFAAWSMGADPFTLRANRYVPGDGWGGEVTIDADIVTTSVSPDIATSGDDAVVVWSKYDGTIHSATYLSTAGWQTATALTTGGTTANPQVAFGGTGKTSVAWNHQYQSNGTWQFGTRVIQYSDGSGWGEPQLLAPNNTLGFSIDLEADGAGNFLAVWTEGPGPTADVVMGNLFQ